MTQTDVTGSLLERYKESLNKENDLTPYYFRKQLEELLTNKYSPKKNFTEENSKLLEEYETYFTWNEDYNFDFDASFCIEGDQSVRVCIDDRDEFLELINQDDEGIENTLEDNGSLESAIDSTKYDGDLYLDCEYTSYRGVSVGVFGLEPKMEFKTPPTQDDSMEVFQKIFKTLHHYQKKNLSSIPSSQIHAIFKEVIENWKTEENIS